MPLPSYPSVRQLGHAEIKGILEDPVVVQEKVDGSQASFGFIDGILQARSKSVQLNLELENFPGLFSKAVKTIKEKQTQLQGIFIVVKFLKSPSIIPLLIPVSLKETLFFLILRI